MAKVSKLSDRIKELENPAVEEERVLKDLVETLRLNANLPPHDMSRLGSRLATIQSLNPIIVVRHSTLGKYNFSEILPLIEEIKGVFSKFPLDPELDDLPQEWKSVLLNQAEGFFNLLIEILNFDAGKIQNAELTRNQIIIRVKNFYNILPVALFQPTVHLYMNKVNPDSIQGSLMKKIEDELGSKRKEISDIIDHLTERSGELESLVETAEKATQKVQQAAAKTGVTQEATKFNTAAADYGTAANWWLSGAILASCIVVFWAFGLAAGWVAAPSTEFTTPIMASYLLGKILFTAVLISIALTCFKNYQANKHNQIVNRHRVDALQTYQTLVEASTPEGKEIILQQAAACIYTPQDTGFNKTGSKDSGTPTVSVPLTLLKTGNG